MCRYYLDSPEIAEDLLHDAFIIIFSSIRSLRDQDKLESWMASIVRHLAIDYLNKNSSGEPWDEDSFLLIPEDGEEDITIPPLPSLLKLVDELPDRYGQVFRMSAFHGLSNKEIAKLLHLKEKTVSSDLFRARKKLREAIRRYLALTMALICLMVGTEVELNNPVQLERFESIDAAVKIISEANVGDVEYAGECIEGNDDECIIDEREDYCVGEYSGKVLNEVANINIGESINEGKDGVKEKPSDENIYWAAPEIKKGKNWWASIAIEGVFIRGYGSIGEKEIQKGVAYDPVTEEYGSQNKKTWKHRYPVRLGLTAMISLNNALSMRVGLEYSYLASTNHIPFNLTFIREEQKIHYLGIPVGIGYDVWRGNNLRIHSFADIAAHLPVYGNCKDYDESSRAINTRKIQAPFLWSVGVGAGLHYDFNDYFSIYAAPGIRYYFGKEGKVETVYTANPLELTFSVGVSIRISHNHLH